MNLNYHYWYFTDIFSKKFLNKILKIGLTAKKQIAITGAQSRKSGVLRDLKKQPLTAIEKEELKKTRDSQVCWITKSFIFDTILPYIKIANKNAGWNFQFDWTEDAQFTVYKKNMHYDWHMDSWKEPYSDDSFPNYRGKIRKISSVLLLSDPKDFKGGELEFDFTNGGGAGKKIATEINKKGSLVVFPSFVKHRVRPVTQGTRYSMPMWYLGNPWQ